MFNILQNNTQANYQNGPRMGFGASILKANHFLSPSRMFVSSRPITINTTRPSLLVTKVETSSKTSENTESSPSNADPAPVENIPEPSNGSVSSPEPNPIQKRLKLTAREKLKAARVRSRFSEPKPIKTPQLGSQVLEALRESDKITGKKSSGLPEAPTNLFDDSKRGMPKKGLTFELPVGWDVFLIILSVVVISTVMFTTTFIVWKVGAIHFNEY